MKRSDVREAAALPAAVSTYRSIGWIGGRVALLALGVRALVAPTSLIWYFPSRPATLVGWAPRSRSRVKEPSWPKGQPVEINVICVHYVGLGEDP